MKPKKFFFWILILVITVSLVVSVSVKAAAVGVPILLSPINGETTSDTTPPFSWQVASGADKYTFEIKKVSDNSVVAKATYLASVRCTPTTCQIPSPTTLALGNYKWHVVAYAGTVKGEWSTYNTLNIGTFSLDTPVLRSPGADAIVYGGRPTFKWYQVTGAARYNVQMLNASDVVLDTWNTNPACIDFCEFRIPYDLETNYGDYKWRVQALNGDASSNWSVPRTFSYVQLERTWLISPSDGYSTQDGSPLLEWGDITGATMYLVQIRRASDETLVIQQLVTDADYCDGSTCGWEVDPILSDESYIWHVRAKNGRNFGRWTAYRDLIIEPADYFYGFGNESTDWIDPDNTWSVVNGIYHGIHGACDYSCATSYLNIIFTDGLFNTYMKTAGTDPGTGFSIYYRAQFDTNGDLVKAYTIDVTSTVTNTITFTFWKFENSSWYSLGSPIVKTGFNITDYHTYSVNVNSTTMTMRFTPTIGSSDILIGTVNNIDPTYTSGLFAVDVISYEDAVHTVEIDWIQVYDADFDSTTPMTVAYTPMAAQLTAEFCPSSKADAPQAVFEELVPGE